MSDMEKWEPVTFGKWIIPCLIIGITLAIPNWFWSEYQYEKSNPYQQCADKSNALGVSPAKGNHPENNTDNSEENPCLEPWWDRPWVIALITLAYAMFAGFQWYAIRDQGKVMGKNVKALMDSERPWILIDSDERGGPRINPPFLTKYAVNARASNCVFYFKNFGRTPAKILSLQMFLNIGEIPARPPAPTEQMTEIIKRDGFILPQGESWPAEARLPAPYMTDDDLNSIFTSKTKYLSLTAIIRYVDSFERAGNPEPFATIFSYFLETRTNASDSFWQIVPAAGCNRAT